MLLYLHIPFCDSKCSYCAFNSYTHLHHRRARYMTQIVEQFLHDVEELQLPKAIFRTLFIGGGTPSTVDAALYERFFEVVRPYLAHDAEITTEANPNSATLTWLAQMRVLGVNRLSLGAQSFDEGKLTWLHRAHASHHIDEAVHAAYSAGIRNISIDLIYGTALDTPALLERDIERAFVLPISHLSAYALTIEEHTPFAATPQVARESLEMTQKLFEAIDAHGFAQYEISNFGTPSRHNLGYWEYAPYLGIGAGAVGRIAEHRRYTHTDVDAYIADPLYRTLEHLSPSDMRIEKILLGLRSRVGVDTALISDTSRIDALIEEGLAFVENNRLYAKSYLLADEIALFLE
ncbi:MAG: coproporphyrinogen III oxidase [Sulfuricurvum sp. PC08-66]|nr:MAG: coproporphyrinogen III oxidase [Sulfuricurvum sp. PC08-66]